MPRAIHGLAEMIAVAGRYIEACRPTFLQKAAAAAAAAASE